jgi:hypothetical protein
MNLGDWIRIPLDRGNCDPPQKDKLDATVVRYPAGDIQTPQSSCLHVSIDSVNHRREYADVAESPASHNLRG